MQETKEMWVWSLGQEDLLEEDMTTYSCIFAKKSHGQRSLVGYSSKGRKESDTIENNTFRMHICLVSHDWKIHVGAQDKEEAINFIPLILCIRIFSYSLPAPGSRDI